MATLQQPIEPAAGWPDDLLAVADLTCIALGALLDAGLEIERDPARFGGALAGETLACASRARQSTVPTG
jgi:hypothetical protein